MARVPGGILFVGVGNRHKKTDFPQHSCFYNIDEDALVGGRHGGLPSTPLDF